MIMSLTAHSTRIAVGDCRDGILFYSYHEVRKNCRFVKVNLFSMSFLLKLIV